MKKSNGVVEKEIVFSASQDTISDSVSSLVMKESLAVVDIEVIEEETTVYNFEVEDDHTYFVTEAEIWVHNADQEKYNAMINKLDNQLSTDANKTIQKDWIDRAMDIGASLVLNPIGSIIYSGIKAENTLSDTVEIDILMQEAIDSEKEHEKKVFENENATASRAIKDEQTKINNLLNKHGISDINEANNALSNLEKTNNIFGITGIEDKALSSKINDLKAIRESQRNISVYTKDLERAAQTFGNRMTALESNKYPVGSSLSGLFNNERDAIMKLNESYKINRLQSMDPTSISTTMFPIGLRAPFDYENYKKTLIEREKRNTCGQQYGIYQSCK